MNMKLLLIFLFVITFFSSVVVYQSVTKSSLQYQNWEITEQVKQSGCSEMTERSLLFSQARLSMIRTLGEYESMCGAAVTNELTYTIHLPKEPQLAASLASQVANDLKEIENFGLQARVLLQLNSKWTPADITEAAKGKLDSAQTLFTALTDLGISSQQIDTIVLYPNANLPYWQGKNILPAEYVSLVSKTLPLLEKTWPDSKVELQFHAMTFESTGFSWGEQEYVPLQGYLEAIPKGQVDSLAIVGFPWLPPANQKDNELLDPAQYLPTTLIKAAAENLGVKKITLVTGTFATLYSDNTQKSVVVPADIRRDWLLKTVDLARRLQQDQYEVKVVLSNEDLRLDAGNAEWGYWGSDAVVNSDHAKAVLDFLITSAEEKIAVGLWTN